MVHGAVHVPGRHTPSNRADENVDRNCVELTGKAWAAPLTAPPTAVVNGAAADATGAVTAEAASVAVSTVYLRSGRIALG